jgi:hypothetical protein
MPPKEAFMRRLLNWLCSESGVRRPARRRPALEQLEDRYALSTLSAVPVASSPGEVFAIAADHSLVRYQGNTTTPLSPAGTILSVSAGRLDDVYAVASDHSLWRWTPSQPGNHWALLSPAGSISEQIFATVQEGEVFVVPTDGSLWHYNSSLPGNHWEMLSPGGTILSISADHYSDLFALASDHSLWEHAGSTWTELSPANTILSVSAGPFGDVFAVAADHSLWHHDSKWSLLSAAGTVEAISAGWIDSEVFAVTADHGLWHYKGTLPGTHWEQLSPAGSMTDTISADYNDEVFAVPTDHSLWEHSSSGWVLRSAAGTML